MSGEQYIKHFIPESENKSMKLLGTRSNSLSYLQTSKMLSGKEHESWVPTTSFPSSLCPITQPLLLC